MKEGIKNAAIEDFPSVVAIFHQIPGTDPPTYYHDGGGSIISPNHIITSAGCVSEYGPEYYLVRAGSTLVDDKGSVHRVQKIVSHPEHKSGTPGHDLALLKLLDPIALDGVTKKAVAMFEPTEKVNPLSVAHTAGWGELKIIDEESVSFSQAEHMQNVELKFVDQRECKDVYTDPLCHNETDTEVCFSYAVQRGEICAVVPGNEVITSSHGDQGGPLFVDDKLAGVMSRWGGSLRYEVGDFKRWPNIVTLVSYFRTWIDEELAKP